MKKFAPIAGTLLLMVMPLPWEHRDRVMSAWWDFAHVPAFAVMTWLLMRGAPARIRRVWLPVVLVPAVEMLQRVTGRDPSVVDALYGWAGCAVGAGYAINRHVEASILLGMTLSLPLGVAVDRIRVGRAFPELALVSGPMERTRWDVTGCDAVFDQGIRLVVGTGAAYPGLFLKDPSADWSSADALELDVDVAGDEDVLMWVRIDDRSDNPPYNDRFQKEITLTPGLNRVRIPASEYGLASGGRPMNTSDVKSVGLFFTSGAAGKTVVLKRIRLVCGGHLMD